MNKMSKYKKCDFYVIIDGKNWHIDHCWISTAGYVNFYVGYSLVDERDPFSDMIKKTFSPEDINAPEREEDLK